MFENLVARDLKIYASSFYGNLSYYSDRYGLEIDFVLTLKNGDYGLIEVKLGANQIEKGIKNLIKFKNLVTEYNKKNKKQIKTPTLLMIITAVGYAYKTKEGIFIIPITCLKN